MFDKMVFDPSLQKFEFLLIPKKENMNILVKIGPLKVSKFDFWKEWFIFWALDVQGGSDQKSFQDG